MFEEVKAKQAAGNASGGGTWLQNIGKGFGYGGAAAEQQPKNFTSSLTHLKDFRGQKVIITGATGGIGAQVARKLLKNGKISYDMHA